MHYLTVQDMLWINLQVAKKVNTYHFATLEEATYYQYALGDSTEVGAQAARFLQGFLKLRPISDLNEATGFVGCLAFLKINGYRLDLDDDEGAAWVRAFLANGSGTLVSRLCKDLDAHHDAKPNIRAAIRSVILAYPKTIDGLTAVSV